MSKPVFLIDVNLPRFFSLWDHPDFIFQAELNRSMPDQTIWNFAREQQLTIVTKDSDFSTRMLVSTPPPRVIHIRIGNCSMRTFFDVTTLHWIELAERSKTHKLVTLYSDRIETIA
jgi:predicted nuclease of predicted toxin-antitoxin system